MQTYELMHAYRPQSSVFGIADHACQQCLSALLPRVFAAEVQVHYSVSTGRVNESAAYKAL